MKRPDVPLALLQIRDLPLVMHQSHSESLAVHAAQRISCYKLPHKLHQVHSAQQKARQTASELELSGADAKDTVG